MKNKWSFTWNLHGRTGIGDPGLPTINDKRMFVLPTPCNCYGPLGILTRARPQ